MIKMNVKAETVGDKIHVITDGEVRGTGYLITVEMAHVLLEFNKIEDGKVLVKAFEMMMNKLEEGEDDE